MTRVYTRLHWGLPWRRYQAWRPCRSHYGKAKVNVKIIDVIEFEAHFSIADVRWLWQKTPLR
jgi:hypothetical protein